MAKSLRSKIKRRFKTLKRTYFEQVEGKQKQEDLSRKQYMILNNQNYRSKSPENAFLKPNVNGSEFPQFIPQKHIDFRSSAIPFSGNEHRGGRRKKINNQTEILENYIPELIQQQNQNQILETGNQENTIHHVNNEDGDENVQEFTEKDLLNVMNSMNILSKNQLKKAKKNNIQIEEETIGVDKKIQKSKTQLKKEKSKNSCKKSKKVFQWN